MIVWKDVRYKDLYLKYYEINNLGEVRRKAGPDSRGRNRKQRPIKAHCIGHYMQIILYDEDGGRHSPLVHTLVAFAFLGDPPSEYGLGKIIVNHKNGNKLDNIPENLEWATHQENSDHASANGFMLVGEKNPAAVLTENQVIQIRYKRSRGAKLKELADEYECSICAIDSACRRITWKHVP